MDDELTWYENPETGARFGFGTPLPAVIADQVQAGRLRACPPNDSPAPAVPEADRDGGAGETLAEAWNELQADAEIAAELDAAEQRQRAKPRARR